MFSCNWKKYSSSNKIVSIQKIPNYDSDRSDKPADSVIGTDSRNTNTNSNSVEMYIICDKNGIIIDISQSVTHTLFYNEHELTSNSVCILMNKLMLIYIINLIFKISSNIRIK